MIELQGKVIEVRPSLDADATKKIGQSLKEMRKLSGLTQAEMARRLEVGQASISKVESGRGDMQISTIKKFVEALGGTLRVTAAFPGDSALSLHMLDAFEVELDHEDQLVLPIFSDDAFRPHRDVVLSIRPQYTSRIMTGEKLSNSAAGFQLQHLRGPSHTSTQHLRNAPWLATLRSSVSAS